MKAVIFDLDGVICFTDKLHYKAWKNIADEQGIYFDEKINDRLRGVSRMESLDIILEKADRTYSFDEKKEIAEKKNDIYVSLLDTMSEKDLDANVKNVLDTLRSRGTLLAIGSSSKNTKKILEKLGLKDFFDAVSDGTNITKSKPDPEVFLKAAEMLGIKPVEAVVVEDALSGIDAALAGGFECVGIGEAATHPKVTYSLKDLADLPEIVLRKNADI
ncbi:MAG: beta-phosphoglucomutase [Butyrivibrio hungatei]|nr:beta-phosphoglucomutase [Butyrivibrio hungatei]